MSYNYKILIALAVLLSLPQLGNAQNPFRRAKLCIDNKKDRVVLRPRCRAPRFTEVTPTILNDASSLGGDTFFQYPKNLRTVSKSVEVALLSRGDSTGNSVQCPEGTIATGGGVSLIGDEKLAIIRSIPSSNLSGWTGGVDATGNNASGTMNIYAVCGESEYYQDDNDDS